MRFPKKTVSIACSAIFAFLSACPQVFGETKHDRQEDQNTIEGVCKDPSGNIASVIKIDNRSKKATVIVLEKTFYDYGAGLLRRLYTAKVLARGLSVEDGRKEAQKYCDGKVIPDVPNTYAIKGKNDLRHIR